MAHYLVKSDIRLEKLKKVAFFALIYLIGVGAVLVLGPVTGVTKGLAAPRKFAGVRFLASMRS